MDTLVEITLYGQKKILEKALTSTISEMKRLELIFNRHSNDSFAFALENNDSRLAIAAPEEYIKVLLEASNISRQTNGAFNPTIAPVIDLWNFSESDDITGIVPERKKIKDMLSLTGWENVVINRENKTVSIGEKIAIDCGGIGKGFIVDQAIKILKNLKVSAALINGGGDLKTFGLKPGNKQFRIGIQNPVSKGEITGILHIDNCAVATSGDYERGFTKDSVYYHHLIDPATGYPGRLSKSCTVVTSNALTADAFATALFIQGPVHGIKTANSIDGLEAAIIDQDLNLVCSTGFKQYLE